MENTTEILKQLKIIKWTFLFVALCALFFASCVGYSTYASTQYMKNINTNNSSCSSNSFRREIKPLIENGELDKAIEASTAHIAKFPNDADGYWYRGKAYYQQEKWQLAIDDYKKTEALEPSWRDEYTAPAIIAAEEKLKTVNKLPQTTR